MKSRSLLLGITVLALPAVAFAGDSEKKGKRDGQMRERIIEKFDADGDGELNEEEREAAKAAMKARKEAFIDKYDTDGDGKLSEEERKAAKDAILAEYDTDGDGKLSEDERKAARDAGEELPGPPKGDKKGGKKGGKKGPRGGEE